MNLRKLRLKLHLQQRQDTCMMDKTNKFHHNLKFEQKKNMGIKHAFRQPRPELVAELHGCLAPHGSSKHEPALTPARTCHQFATGCEPLGSLATVLPLCVGTCASTSYRGHEGSTPAGHDLNCAEKKLNILTFENPTSAERS